MNYKISRHRLGALRCGLLGGAIALCASGASAQVSGPPSIMQPKEAAQRAAGRVSAHTATMEAPQDPASQSSTQGTPRAGSPAPRTAVGTPARGTARTAASTSRTARDSARSGVSTSVSKRGELAQISLYREVFAYEHASRRDPFVSLITSGELRPMISDLRLVTVIYDAAGRSVAILRDVSTKQQYRVKVGHELGRMRVASIRPKSVTFTIDEFGFNRQEILALGDPLKERTQ